VRAEKKGLWEYERGVPPKRRVKNLPVDRERVKEKGETLNICTMTPKAISC